MIENKLNQALQKGFINKELEASTGFGPQLVVNEPNNKKYVLNSITEDIETCQSFIFSVAFITESGLMALKKHLYELALKGINGRIITSDYLSFNSPKIFKELLKLPNVEVRITSEEGFHTKGYLFDFSDHYSAIIGSSNLTIKALKTNYEWNMKLNSLYDGEITSRIKDNIELLWRNSKPLSVQWIDEYSKRYMPFISLKHIDGNSENEVGQVSPYDAVVSVEEESYVVAEIMPNKMQQDALKSIAHIRKSGQQKALVISATGTGKTYLSAFDVRNAKPKKMLFIVHREQILKKAKKDFFKVIGGEKSDYGILSGSCKNRDAKYLFATIQTISKQEELSQFNRDEFDYILIDEVHKAGAATYNRLIDYFEPDFLMGMTATPERSDEFNIFELFDYNIAYEIRLEQALEENMLCPFHYFGITDFEKEGKIFEETSDIAILASEERVEHVIKHLEYYGFSGDSVRGLIFVSRKQEATELSELLNTRGYRTVALTSNQSSKSGEREKAVEDLENGHLDYIITVDIFNEGIDIPSVNQIVMLRQTKSSIIFIQQLGRGLRKHPSKEFVTIIDFIGNYKNNYLIPIALSGDTSLNKNELLKKTLDLEYLEGISTINFDEITKKRIFDSIKTATLNRGNNYRAAYTSLKNRMGRIPLLMDFIEQNSADPEVIATYKNNYYKFLRYVKEDVVVISETGNYFLTLLTIELLNGKRPHELLLLKELIERGQLSEQDYLTILKEKEYYVDSRTIISVLSLLDLSFYTDIGKKRYGNLPIVQKQGSNLLLTTEFLNELTNPFFAELVYDIINVGLTKSEKYDNTRAMTLKEKYTRKDVCRLLNWANNEEGTLYGYQIKYGTCPIFVTYHKALEEGSTQDYEDSFINEDTLNWSTRGGDTLESKSVKRLMNETSEEVVCHIFIQKQKGEPFYYFGDSEPNKKTATNEVLNGSNVAHIEMKLETSVDKALYDFLRES